MIAVFLLGAAAVLLLSGYLYGRYWIRALTVRVSFSRPHVCAGEVLELTEAIENRKKMALPILEIAFRIPQGLHFEDAENTLVSDYIYKRDIFAVAGMEKIIRRYLVTAQKRGYYEVSQLICQTPSRMFGQIYRVDDLMPEGTGGLYVYPENTDCSLLLRAVEVILGEVESARRLYEDPFVFASIRPYTIRDPLKSVNWKATAKTGELMVNTYASTSAVRVRIFLDVSTDPALPFSDSLRELGIAMAASLVRTLVKRQKDAALMVNCLTGREEAPGCVRFSSCQSAGQMTALEEYLTTDFDAAALLPFEEMLRQETGQKTGRGGEMRDEIFLFLTSSDRPSLRDSIRKLLGTGHSGILAVLSRTADGRREEHERNLYILPVCAVR